MKTQGTLYKRGSKWRWKIKVPAALLHLPHYQNADGKPKQLAADVNLDTEDKAEAIKKATALAAEWLERFDAERKARAVQSPFAIPDALVSAVASRVYEAVLSRDMRLRSSPVELAEWLADLWRSRESERRAVYEKTHPGEVYPAVPLPYVLSNPGIDELRGRPAFLGIPPELLKLLREQHAETLARVRSALSAGNLAPYVMLSKSEALKLGVNLGADAWLDPKYASSPIHKACREAYVSALEFVSKTEGVLTADLLPEQRPATGVATKGTGSSQTHSLRDVFERWVRGGDNPAQSSVRKKLVAVKLYEQFTNNAPIESLTPEQGDDFASWLKAQCKAQKTAKDHLESVKSLLNRAAVTTQGGLRWIQENPWRGLRIRVRQRTTRKPWSSGDLIKLFDSSLFKAYELPTTPSAGRSAAYWVPLLGLYTGARQSELCQLRVSDVAEDDGGLMLFITSEQADDDLGILETSTKSEVSRRRIPVHSELLRLGFRDYWKDMVDAGNAALFPDVIRAPNRAAGEYFSDWFLIYRREQGINAKWVDFHAFRHTASTRLTDAGVPDSASDYLTGHASAVRGSSQRYKHMQELRFQLEKLNYPELRLGRVYHSRGR